MHGSEQIELGRSQVYGLAVVANASPGDVELQPAFATGFGAVLGSAKNGSDPGNELFHRERLGQIVVGPDTKPDKDVGLVGAGGQHDHGHPPLAVDPAADLEPIEAAEVQIEDEEVGPVLGRRFHCRRTVRGLDGPEPFRVEAVDHGLGDRRLILHDEDGCSVLPPLHAHHAKAGRSEMSCTVCEDVVQNGSMPLGPSWTIGETTVTSIIELDQHWKFDWLLPDVEAADIEANEWLRPHFIDAHGKMILRIQALIVESQDQRIVVDTCVGNDKDRPSPLFDKLQTNFFDDLVAAGFGPETIDQVVCTHLHVDHVGWNTRLVDHSWVPTFPRANYLFGRIEYDHWAEAEDAAMFGDVMVDSVQPVIDAALAIMVESDHLLTEEVQLEPTPGHTPGHHSIRIFSAGVSAVITGDMIHHPVQLARPALSSSADTDQAAATATRRASLERWHGEGLLVIGTHFAGPGAGRLTKQGDGWRLVIEN